MAYVDALFFASGLSTQAGLNPLNINDLVLYQQVIMYLVPMFTNPIFIHSSVVFLRLYWFEKHFENINENSKLQSRMRRTLTMARANTRGSQGDRDIEATVLSGIEKKSFPTTMRSTDNAIRSSLNGIPGPPDSPDSSGSPGHTPTPPAAPQDRDIRFGDLPSPPNKQRQHSFAPHDMYMSINLMQQNRRLSNDNLEGPAFVVKGPLEQDGDNDNTDEEDEEDSPGSTLARSRTHVPPHVQVKVDLGKRSHTIDGPGTSNHGGRPVQRSRTFERLLSFGRNNRSDADSHPPLRRTMTTNYLSWEPTVGRNSFFVGLTEEQKEELGGVEYRSLKLLAKILIVYFVGLHLLGAIMLLPWSIRATEYADYIRSCGVSSVWWSFFSASSAFNDVGYTLTPNSFNSFTHAIYILLTLSFFIVVGNTGFPCFLRFVIWVMFKCSSEYGRSRESLGFLLDHPRRCFTLLFPSSATWWLFGTLVVLNSTDLIFFLVLDLNSQALEEIPTVYRVFSGLFQAFSTRTAGFTVVDLAELHPAVQVSYMIMMYVSVLPIAISVRRTNVYEEQSLGVYYDDEEEDPDKAGKRTYIATHLRRQLSFDLWYIFLGLFIICIVEGTRIERGGEAFSIFSILFEVVSAYGTVGLSLGYPGTNTSFSGQFKVLSKLVIMAMMIRGRHRGLPYGLDRAIILPNDNKLKRTDSGLNPFPTKPRRMSTFDKREPWNPERRQSLLRVRTHDPPVASGINGHAETSELIHRGRTQDPTSFNYMNNTPEINRTRQDTTEINFNTPTFPRTSFSQPLHRVRSS